MSKGRSIKTHYLTRFRKKCLAHPYNPSAQSDYAPLHDDRGVVGAPGFFKSQEKEGTRRIASSLVQRGRSMNPTMNPTPTPHPPIVAVHFHATLSVSQSFEKSNALLKACPWVVHVSFLNDSRPLSQRVVS